MSSRMRCMGPTLPTARNGRSVSSSASSRSPHSECLTLTHSALAAWMAERGQPAYRVTQVLSWIYRRRAAGFAAMSDVPQGLRDALSADFELPTLTPTVVAHARDDTRKLLFELDERAAIES